MDSRRSTGSANLWKYEDADLRSLRRRLRKKIGRLSHQPKLAYSIQVLAAPVVNVFAVPEGMFI